MSLLSAGSISLDSSFKEGWKREKIEQWQRRDLWGGFHKDIRLKRYNHRSKPKKFTFKNPNEKLFKHFEAYSFTLTTVQMPNLVLTGTKRITVWVNCKLIRCCLIVLRKVLGSIPTSSSTAVSKCMERCGIMHLQNTQTGCKYRKYTQQKCIENIFSTKAYKKYKNLYCKKKRTIWFNQGEWVLKGLLLVRVW
jgi:hypothetical protein